MGFEYYTLKAQACYNQETIFEHESHQGGY